jgi:hypothetical protein
MTYEESSTTWSKGVLSSDVPSASPSSSHRLDGRETLTMTCEESKVFPSPDVPSASPLSGLHSRKEPVTLIFEESYPTWPEAVPSPNALSASPSSNHHSVGLLPTTDMVGSLGDGRESLTLTYEESSTTWSRVVPSPDVLSASPSSNLGLQPPIDRVGSS